MRVRTPAGLPLPAMIPRRRCCAGRGIGLLPGAGQGSPGSFDGARDGWGAAPNAGAVTVDGDQPTSTGLIRGRGTTRPGKPTGRDTGRATLLHYFTTSLLHYGRPFHRQTAEPQDSPDPNPTRRTRFPGSSLPDSMASMSANGIDAEEVFPVESMVDATRSESMPRRPATDSMIRALA